MPVSASSKGTAQGQPLDQSGTFANGVATLVTNGKSQSIPYQQGASWMGGNIFFPNVFILARYDESKGGVQQFPVFPSVTVTVERKAEDGVKSDGGESASFTRFVMRVATQEIVYWRDAAGRLAIIALPAQRFTASRPESAKWAPLLLTNLANPSPSSPSSSPSSSSSASNTVDYSAPATAPFSAEEVSIPVSSYALAGTLLLPKSGKRPFTAVVMITGSGLQTRDSRIPMPGLEQYAPCCELTIAALVARPDAKRSRTRRRHRSRKTRGRRLRGFARERTSMARASSSSATARAQASRA
jgi:hypothetical protein